MLCGKAIVITLLVVSQTTNSSANQTSQAEQEVLKLNKEYDEAIVRRDAAAFDRLMADDFSFTSSDGEVVTKAQEIANLKSGDTKIESGKVVTFKCGSMETLL